MTFSPAARLQCLRRQGRPVKRKNTGASKRPASSTPSCLILSFRTVFGKPAFALATSGRSASDLYWQPCRLRSGMHATRSPLQGTWRNDACASLFSIGRWALSVGRFPSVGADDLHLVPEPLLVPMRPHAFAALVLGNFCFSSFLKRAHSVFPESQGAIQPSNPPCCNSVSLASVQL